MKKTVRRALLSLLLLLFAGPLLVACSGKVRLFDDWRTADRASAGIAPDPATVPEAVVLVYAARAFEWRGAFAVHTWIATKRAGAAQYQVHHVVGWRLDDTGSAVVSGPDLPDRAWYGQPPALLRELRGPGAESAIDDILRAVASYPYADRYTAWPGPNSNTFTAWVGRQVPALRLDLPPTAIGKDYLGRRLIAPTPSGTGWQFSLLGIAGIALGREEGLELNLLGIALGLNPLDFELRLPGIGTLGGGPIKG